MTPEAKEFTLSKLSPSAWLVIHCQHPFMQKAAQLFLILLERMTLSTYLSLPWWVFTSAKPPSAYFRRASHCWCCSAGGMHAWAFVWCLCPVGGSQFTYSVLHQLNGDLHVEDITCVFGCLEFACNCLKLCTVWFGATVNLVFLNLDIKL